jgi:TonB family protein
MNYRVFICIAITLLVIGAQASALADSWRLPTKTKYYSSNKNYYLEVTPKKLESQLQYFKDKVEGIENAGALKEMKNNRAKGVFYARRAGGEYSKKWEFPLVNEVSPVSVLISDKGNYVVTFDNWHGIGYGDSVVVIYHSNGDLIRKFGLEDLLTEGDIEVLPHSISSIHWGAAHYLDEANDLLILRVNSSWTENAKSHQIKISLATGQPLEPKRDLFPQLRVFSNAYTETMLEPTHATVSKPNCSSAQASFDLPDVVRIQSEQFYASAKERPLPPYPMLAKLAHVESTVVVEVLLSKTGEVICTRSLSGHPLVRETALTAVLKWRFEPVVISGKPVKVIGTIAINFKVSESDMKLNPQPRNQ